MDNNELFEITTAMPVQTIVNVLYNSMHYPERKGFSIRNNAHYKEILPGKQIRIPWATEIEPIAQFYVNNEIMPCVDINKDPNTVINVSLVGFYNNSVKNNVVVKSLSTDEIFEVPVEGILLGWLETNMYRGV